MLCSKTSTTYLEAHVNVVRLNTALFLQIIIKMKRSNMFRLAT